MSARPLKVAVIGIDHRDAFGLLSSQRTQTCLTRGHVFTVTELSIRAQNVAKSVGDHPKA
jgi:hypothetical protein